MRFSDYFELDNSVTVHHKNLQVLVIEIFKINGIAPEYLFLGFLIWAFNSRNWSNKISRINERASRLVHENNLRFSGVFELENFSTVHHKNLKVFVTEIYKVKNGIAPGIMKDIFEFQKPSYNYRSSSNQVRRENIKTVNHGTQSRRYLGTKILRQIILSSVASEFKILTKPWKPETSLFKYHSFETTIFMLLLLMIRLALFRHTFNNCELLCNFNYYNTNSKLKKLKLN